NGSDATLSEKFQKEAPEPAGTSPGGSRRPDRDRRNSSAPFSGGLGVACPSLMRIRRQTSFLAPALPLARNLVQRLVDKASFIRRARAGRLSHHLGRY